MVIKRQKGDGRRIHAEEAELHFSVLSHSQNDLLEEISQHVKILGTKTDEASFSVKVIGSPDEVQKVKSLSARAESSLDL